MNKEDFKMLMYALYGNKQLIIPDGQTLQEWIDNAFVEKQEEAINYTHSCKSDSELLLFSADEIVSKINEQTVLDGETFRVYFCEK